MERGVLIAVAALRWVAWIWLAVVAVANLHRVDHPAVAVAAVVLTGLVTVAARLAVRRTSSTAATRPPLVAAEVAVAIAVVAADGWVRQGRITGQALAGTWPLAAILVSAVAGGPLWGAGVGAVLGAARSLSTAVAGVGPGQAGRTVVATASTVLFWMAVGAVCGVMIGILRRTQDRLSEASARDAIARDLHDGVLQTLALIERRSDNPDIARLAREQEHELRAYLFGDHQSEGELAPGLRAAAARAEQAWPAMTVTVTVSDDAPTMAPESVDAAVRAAAEAITNAAKHGDARHVVVFADVDEPSGGLFLSVKDDGTGFDPAALDEGTGLRHSIRGRVEGVGGTVALSSHPGDGSEVRITIPAGRTRRRVRG
ncbi:MAG TPA: ATP-binding protein [Acidimicrobiales bacterium]